jgi:hypothetical protein
VIKQLNLAQGRLRFFGKPDLNFFRWNVHRAAYRRFGVIYERALAAEKSSAMQISGIIDFITVGEKK